MFCGKTFSNPNSKYIFFQIPRGGRGTDYEVPKSFVVVFVFFPSTQRSLCRDVTNLRSLHLLCTDAPSPQIKGGGVCTQAALPAKDTQSMALSGL